MKNSSMHYTIISLFILGFGFKLEAQPNINYDVHNNVFLWGCTYNGSVKGIFTYVLGVNGGSGSYTISPSSSIAISKTAVGSGEIFEVFVPLNTSLSNIHFNITDVQGGSISINEDVKNFLHYASNTAYLECSAPGKCTNTDIVHTEDEWLTPDLYQADNSITSQATLPDRNTIFRATDDITLLPGFSTVKLTNFVAEIVSNCN